MRAAAVIVAAGKGERAGGSLPKQFASIGAKPALRWSIEAFANHPAFGEIVVVCDPAHAEHVAAAAAGLPVRTTPGGAVRSASVRAGLEALAAEAPQFVFIHDAARPGLSHTVIDALLAALEHHPGAAPALRIADALKKAGDGFALADVAREGLVRVQTPQAFRFSAIRAAFEALDSTAALDDDVAVARAAGHAVALVPGELRLSKITYPEDFALVERLVAPAAFIPLVGQGLDAHRFCEGSFVTLCGVQAPHTHGLEGHSDADAGWHALTDAILGAIGAGDIGDHFPPSDNTWKGAPSRIFLEKARDLVVARGGAVTHCDVTLICEAPKIGPHRATMRRALAEIIGIDEDRVSVKATTTEELGFTGRREGIAALATATVRLPSSD